MKDKKLIAVIGMLFIIVFFVVPKCNVIVEASRRYISSNNQARVSQFIDDLSEKELKKISRKLDINLIGDFKVESVMSCPLCDKTRVVIGDIKDYEKLLNDKLKLNIENTNKDIKEDVTYSNRESMREENYKKTSIQVEGKVNIFMLEGIEEVKKDYFIYEKQDKNTKSLARFGFDRKELNSGGHDDCTSDKELR